jgi:uncharacterized repeat protein (TIGR04138 family)
MSDQDSAIDRINEAASRLGFDPEAFLFVYAVLTRASQDLLLREGVRKHISALELSRRLCQIAVREYGTAASEQMHSWNVTTTNDFGVIVFSLAELGFIGTEEGESIDDFRDLFDLEDAISALLDSQRAQPRPKFYQFRLSSLLFVTTVSAFAFAGYAKEKLAGAVAALYFGWLMTIGVACWWLTFRDRRTHWLPGAIVGTLMIAIAAVIFRFLFVG